MTPCFKKYISYNNSSFLAIGSGVKYNIILLNQNIFMLFHAYTLSIKTHGSVS